VQAIGLIEFVGLLFCPIAYRYFVSVNFHSQRASLSTHVTTNLAGEQLAELNGVFLVTEFINGLRRYKIVKP